MHADYTAAAQFAQTWGLGFFVIMFLVAAAYALWPRNSAKFRDAANIPLDDDNDTTIPQRSAGRGQ